MGGRADGQSYDEPGAAPDRSGISRFWGINVSVAPAAGVFGRCAHKRVTNMDDSTKKRLTSILDSFDAKRDAAKKDTERKRTEREIFLDKFAEKVKAVIRPAMEQVAELLKARGHNSEITEQMEAIDSDGRARNAGITLTIFPLGVRPPYPNEHACPHIAFMVNSYESKIYVHESTMMLTRGGQSGSAGEYDIDKVTPELVEQHIVSVLQQAMGKD